MKIYDKVLVDLDGIVNVKIKGDIPTREEVEQSYRNVLSDIIKDYKVLNGKEPDKKEVEESVSIFINQYFESRSYESIIKSKITCFDKDDSGKYVGIDYFVDGLTAIINKSKFKNNKSFECKNQDDYCYWVSEGCIIKVLGDK